MDDLGGYRVPREVDLGREVDFESRRPNRAPLLFLGGILVACVCLVLALGIYFGVQIASGDLVVSFGTSPTPTPAVTSKTPTVVAYGKSVKNDNGLAVTVTAFQRPLPTQDIQIPEGQELVLVSVRLENTRTTGGPIKYAPDEFSLVSPEGDHFNINIGGITTGENLKPGEVAPGKTAKGDLIFYVYSDVSNLQLAWTSADGKTRLLQVSR